MCINLRVLKEDTQLASGDPIFCEGCRAAFNMHSKITKENFDVIQELNEEDNENGETETKPTDQIWKCEFCNYKNKVAIDKEEIPDKDSINYVVEGGEEVKIDEEVKQDISSLIFCIDISGSMNTKWRVDWDVKQIQSTTQDMIKPKSNKKKKAQVPSQNEKINLLSRLECVKAAINSQIENMKVASASKKVGLVTFESYVNIIGDGTQKPTIIKENDMLNNFESLLETAQDCSRTHMSTKIGDTFEDLQNKVWMLKPVGSTALGPAVLWAIAMAGEGSKGSTVVIWTDGVANIGLGQLGSKISPEAEEFYERVAEFAKERGVTVNIISIKGQDCDLETLVTLSEKTNGVVNVIEPNNLQDNFEMMLKKEIIASNVSVRVHLHKGLEFRNENELLMNKEKTLMNRSIGNATNDSEITFEYKIKTVEELKLIEDFNIDDFKEIPFQAIIEYTKLNGIKYIRIITKTLKVSDDADEVQKNADINILAVNAAQQASKLAKKGNFREAQAYTKNQKRFIKKNMRDDRDKEAYSKWKGAMGEMYDQLYDQNNMEEELFLQAESMPADTSMKSKKEKKGFISKLNDAMSNNMYKAMQFNSQNLQ